MPFRGEWKLEVGRYYLRRYTRVLIPVAGALCVYRLSRQQMRLVGEHLILWESPLWSVLCEAIYYAAYPGLRWLRHRFGWRSVLAIAFLASVGVAATNVHTLTWPTFGPFGTALILLPVWLLGCACSRSRARDCRRRAAPCRSEAGAFWRGSDAGPARFCTSKRAFPIRKR